MAKIKVAVLGTVGRSVSIDSEATNGAKIGTNLFMADGSVASKTSLLAYLGLSGGQTTGITAHRLLEGLALGNDHPQYTRKDTLTTRGDLYVRDATTVTRLAKGSTSQFLQAGATDPAWQTISPVITLSTDLSGNTTLTNLTNGTLAATIVNDAVTDAKLRDSAALSVIGRATNSSGDPADIAAGSDGGVLRRSGTALGFGDIPESSVTNLVSDLAGKVPTTRTVTAGTGLTGGGDLSADRTFNVGAGTGITVNADDVAITTNGVTNALFRQSAALTVVGRAANSTGNVADIAATADDQLLRRTGSALDFGQLTVGMFPASVVTYAKIQNVSATSRVLGRITAGSGVIEELTGANLATIIGTSLGANPSASVGLTAVNGSAGTYMRSDAAPALDQSIAPTWTGVHVYSHATTPITLSSVSPEFRWNETDGGTNAKLWGLAASSEVWSMFTRLDDSSFGSTALNITRSGSSITGIGLFATVSIGNAAPELRFNETDGSADNKLWGLAASSETFSLFTRLDNGSFGATALSIDRTGSTVDSLTVLAVLLHASGSASNPSMSFSADTDTGFFRNTANAIGVALGGSQALQINGVTTTGAQTATFIATNKPGSATAGPISWLPVLTAGGTQGYIPIFGV